VIKETFLFHTVEAKSKKKKLLSVCIKKISSNRFLAFFPFSSKMGSDASEKFHSHGSLHLRKVVKIWRGIISSFVREGNAFLFFFCFLYQ